MSDVDRESERAAKEQAEKDARGRSTMDELPGILRLGVSAAWHTTEWAATTYLRAGRRLLGIAAAPETAPAIADELRQAVGGLRRDATGQRKDNGDRDPDELWEELRDLGAEVLRKSRDVNYHETAHPAYERILGDLAPDEARILRLFMVEGPQPTIDVRTGGPLALLSSHLIAQGISMIGPRAGCRYPDRVPQYLNNLFRLGMVWFSRETLHDPVPYQVLEAQPETIEATKSVRMAKIVRRSVHLTPFGEDFCRICLAIDSDRLDSLPAHADPEGGEGLMPPETMNPDVSSGVDP